MNPVIFGTGFFFAFTLKETNLVAKITGFITKPNTLNTMKNARYFESEYFQIRNLLLCSRTGFSVNPKTFYGFYGLRVLISYILVISTFP